MLSKYSVSCSLVGALLPIGLCLSVHIDINLYDKYGISPDRIASVVAFAIDQPEDTTVNEFTVGPANQPW